MSKHDDSDSDGEVIGRGKTEKDKLSKTIFTKRKLELENFFRDYRNFVKGENKKSDESRGSTDFRNKMFEILHHELDVTLTQAQKEYLVKQWKQNTTAPIILLNDTSQLNEIRGFLNTMDICRVNVSREKQIVDIQSNGFMACSNESNPQDYERLELVQQLKDNLDFVELSNSPPAPSVEELFRKISDMIQNKQNVLQYAINVKTSFGYDQYRKVMQYHLHNLEPIMFQLALNLDTYEDVIDMLRVDSCLGLDLKNSIQINIFSYLLVTDLEGLYRFLMYLKKVNLVGTVKVICSQDQFFQKAIWQMKNETPSSQQPKRMMILGIERFCLNQ